MISYTLPGLSEFADINLLFMSFYCDVRDIFFDDVTIESVYGGFPGSALCGGRNNPGEALPDLEIKKLIQRYNDLGIACHVTFTNQFATTKRIDADSYSRRILELLDEVACASSVPTGAAEEEEGTPVRNGVIIYTDDMLRYVREHHPRLRTISSTTKELLDIIAIEEELGRCDRVVLNYNLTHSEPVLAAISDPRHLEVMVNEYCTLGCEYRSEHYRRTSECQLAGKPCDFRCRHKPAPQVWGFLNGLLEGDVFLKNGDIRAYAEKYDIGSFKIVGRGLSRYDVIDSYLYYLVKPEHWYEVRDYLVHRNYL